MRTIQLLNFEAVDRAFSKQAEHYDEDDITNPILTEWRQQVYTHVDKFLKPNSFILELNAGTGIDAVRFVEHGHRVHATDLSDGMIKKINQKIKTHNLLGNLSCQQCSFEALDQVQEKKFDYIFSNFGGLNCADDLAKITRHFSTLLKPGGYATLVIMPPISLWEWLWLFKGHGRKAFRRLTKKGTVAHLEGEYFQTYYHSLSAIKQAFGSSFEFIASEGLGVLSPPPSKAAFVTTYPKLYSILQGLDKSVRYGFPFNRWGDHIIVTFQSKFKTAG